MSKSCYMHFQPKKLDGLGLDHMFSQNILEIMGTPIKPVKSAKFLGITIDDELTWNSHISNLTQKLNCQIAAISRIKDCVPRKFYLDLYHTLFESHLSYCISVWGGVKPNRLEPLLKLQKSITRMLFGQNSQKLKRMTCARCRILGKQVLDASFYEKEHTKPLYAKHFILTVNNLYIYHCFIELFKILKYRQPYSLFECFNLRHSRKSTRYDSTYIDIPGQVPITSNIFTYKAAKVWNYYRLKLEIQDFQISVDTVKLRLKTLIMSIQNAGDTIFWNCQNVCGYE